MIRRLVFVSHISALIVGISACGTSGTNDDTGQGASGSGASSASGGSNSGGSNSGGSGSGAGGAAGTNAGGAAGASSCPPSLPPSGSACSVPSLRCSYGQSICSCMVNLGQPGGIFWLCDGGGSGGSGGSGGGGGTSSDPCGGCAEGELCIHQGGGPGPTCACVMGQGTCTYQMETTDAGVAGICVCDNGLE